MVGRAIAVYLWVTVTAANGNQLPDAACRQILLEPTGKACAAEGSGAADWALGASLLQGSRTISHVWQQVNVNVEPHAEVNVSKGVSTSSLSTALHSQAASFARSLAGNRSLLSVGAWPIPVFFGLGAFLILLACFLGRFMLSGEDDEKAAETWRPRAPGQPYRAQARHQAGFEESAFTAAGSLPAHSPGMARANAAAASQRSMPTAQLLDPSGTSSESEWPATLCVDLLVPDGDECTLQVPRLSLAERQTVNVDSMRGASVFQAMVNPEGSKRRLVLANPSGEVVFGFCRDGQRLGSLATLTIHDHLEAEFGMLHADAQVPGDFIFKARRGFYIHFHGSPHVQAKDDQNCLLATTEPVRDEDSSGAVQAVSAARLSQGALQTRRPVRIGPQVDAGLIVLCFLGMDLLQPQRSTKL